ncbi:hypothetical protein HPB49_007647 [Dermacentor silvarum]|uniref:Uncharacterized protein n=1 Tax=Dermacentor silvarum TaxID=543639 RepID=A0ACB8CW87_DERSI|nr:hypothetical protein HPB49_007647 [Dermacentor silvarum]
MGQDIAGSAGHAARAKMKGTAATVAARRLHGGGDCREPGSRSDVRGSGGSQVSRDILVPSLREKRPIYFGGQSYAHYVLSQPLDRRLSFSVMLRTLQPSGTLLHTSGPRDYAILEAGAIS